MTGRGIAFLLAGVLVVGGVSYSAWRLVAERSTHICKACDRAVHSHSRTVSVLGGKRAIYCCPACALSEQQQSGKPVDVVELTSYSDGQVLAPKDSYVVRNSDVNSCARREPAVNSDKQPMQLHFDRCAPSILAFRDRGSAEVFAGQHGGQVMMFTALEREYSQP